MTLLGKVFTALIALLSVIFFALAIAVNLSLTAQMAASQKNKLDAENAQREVTQVRGELENLKTELAIQQAARRSAIASMQEQLATATTNRETAERSNRDLQSALTAANQTIEANTVELEARAQENQLLRQQLVDTRADRDQMFQRLASATDQTNRVLDQLRDLSEQNNALADNYTKAKELLEILDITPDTLLTPPPVNGEVLAVDGSGLVELSLGRDDGMRAGFTLDVHRGGQYLGRVEIRTVRDDKSTARILDDFRRGYIRAGDRVASNLIKQVSTR